MAEYDVLFERIREPDKLLPEGTVVSTHTHNADHITHLTMGLWEVHRFQPIVGADGAQLSVRMDVERTILEDSDAGPVEKKITVTEDVLQWTAMPVLKIEGGGPRSMIPIPKNMMHKFVLLKGWGFYRCVFAARDADGNLAEAPMGYEHWHV